MARRRSGRHKRRATSSTAGRGRASSSTEAARPRLRGSGCGAWQTRAAPWKEANDHDAAEAHTGRCDRGSSPRLAAARGGVADEPRLHEEHEPQLDADDRVATDTRALQHGQLASGFRYLDGCTLDQPRLVAERLVRPV